MKKKGREELNMEAVPYQEPIPLSEAKKNLLHLYKLAEA